jgi:DNA polymerase elongation subunit (family B)
MKILALDIETAPNLAFVWGLWNQNIGINQIEASGYTLCYSAKWVGSKPIIFDSLHINSSKKMIKGLHKLMNEADAILHYNGKKFDIPTINKEFVTLGLTPPSPYKHIDLLNVCRQNFRFPSNKLDYISQALGLGEKVRHNGHELWVGCMRDDHESWKVMERYNKHDVVLLEKLYEKLKPWIKNHPNHNLYNNGCCTNCGSDKLQSRGYGMTNANVYRRVYCTSCGTWMRENTPVKQGKVKYKIEQ